MRGRSTTPDRHRANVQHLGRSELAAFCATLKLNDKIEVTSRIVALSRAAPTEAQVPFTVLVGEVMSIDDLNTHGKPKSITVDYEHDGNILTYPFPPQALSDAFIEVSHVAIAKKPLPTWGEAASKKRPRDIPPPGPDTPLGQLYTLFKHRDETSNIKELAEALKGEEFKSKVTICPGLRIIEDTSDIWHPFQIFTWVQMFKATATEAQRNTTLTAWKVELLQSILDLGVSVSSSQLGDLRAYNEARDQYGRWLLLSHIMPLDNKEQWIFGFHHLFNVCATITGLKFGQQRGSQLGQELIVEFQKSAAVVDVAAILNRVFRGRRNGSSADYPNARRTQPREPRDNSQRTLGTNEPVPGAKHERQCRYCKKYHQGADWTTHRCK